MQSTAVTVIHKFIRREMFDFAVQLFRAGPTEIPSIRRNLDEVAGLLRRHAEYEDSNIEPLLRKIDPERAERMAEDHRRLDDELERLCDAARALNPAATTCSEALLQLHLDWNRFVGAYLAHLDEEERTFFPVLGDQAPTLAVIAGFAKSQGSELGKAYLLRLWAVTTCLERTEIEAADGVPDMAMAS